MNREEELLMIFVDELRDAIEGGRGARTQNVAESFASRAWGAVEYARIAHLISHGRELDLNEAIDGALDAWCRARGGKRRLL